jgi:hypothetical protein
MRFSLKIWKCIVLQPRLLSEDRKQNLDVSKELADRTNADENCVKKIVTSDESCVYAYDVETQVQSSP